MEKRMEAKIDQKLESHSIETKGQITKLFHSHEENLQREQQSFYGQVASLIQLSIKEAMAEEQGKSTTNKENLPNPDNMDMSGSPTLPLKRNEPNSPHHYKPRNLQTAKVKPSDWIQKSN